MNNGQSGKPVNFKRVMKRFLLSAFVLFSFAAYAIEKQFTSAEGSTDPVSPSPTIAPPLQGSASGGPVPAVAATPSRQNSTVPPQQSVPVQAPQPTLAPSPIPPSPTAVASSGLYKDGTYTGPEIDAFYGLVQIQTVIQNGKIADVEFLKYPNDRRTSVRINNYAVPYLQQEALQAQNANVDIITGATLTSQAFMMSLQSALDQAKNGL